MHRPLFQVVVAALPSIHSTPSVFSNGMSNLLAGKVNVLYARGIPSIQDIFFHTEFTQLKEEVFEGEGHDGQVCL
jgi:hypothetical protein